jgi:tetratricopeptide (TPR) repeat protein
MRFLALSVGLGLLAATAATSAASAPNDDRKTCLLGSAGDSDKEVAACSRAIASGRLQDHDLAKVIAKRAGAYIEKGDFNRGLADLDQSVRVDPKDVETRRVRGIVHLMLGAYRRAVSELTEAIALDPEDLNLIVLRGVARARNGDDDGAIADCGEAAKLKSDRSDAYACLGYAYNDKRDYDRAIADLDKAIVLNPNEPSSFKERGRSYNAKKDYDRAIADFDKAIGFDPGLPVPLIRLGRGEAFVGRAEAFRAKGENEKALADYHAALLLIAADDPLNQEVSDKIAALKAPIVEPTAPTPKVASATPPAYLGRRVALVIGNADYRKAILANPTTDADLVAASLRSAGFDVTEAKNVDFAAFDSSLTAFAAKEDGADIALFYFAGHGFAIAGDDLRPRNYLMATSADMQATSDAVLRRDGISIDEVIKRISAPAKVTLAFVDACRNDPFHRGAGDRGFERIGVSVGRQIYIGMSTELGKTAIDGEVGKGSPFARAFAEKMSAPGLRIDDAFRALRAEVSRQTDGKQQPEILQDDLDQGAIVLVKSQ